MKKNKTRREFIELGLKTGVALPFLSTSLLSCNQSKIGTEKSASNANKKLKILILGGTSFLGPHQIAYAMSRGHSVTTFTRGKTQPTIYQELYENVEQLIGDRNDNLSALENRKWDVVIDNSGHNVEWTRKSAALLKNSCKLYLYTSSTGVFYPYVDSEFKETSPVLLEEPDGVTDEEMKLEYWYGVMKSNSELAAIEEFGKDRVIVVRPTYMIGPADKSDRFIHWPIRLSKGGEVLVPGKETDMVQYLDVRDAAEWMIRLSEDKKVGTYNAVGPSNEETIYEFVDSAKAAFDVDTSFVIIDDYEFLLENGISNIVPWIMPMGNNAGSAKINNEKAIKNGLTFRPLSESVIDTFEWWNSGSITQDKRDTYEKNPDSILAREKSIIAAWKS